MNLARRKGSWLQFFGLALALTTAGNALALFPKNPSASSIWIAEIRGTINPASSNFLKSTLQKAESEKAQALLIELDTPGGLLSSVREMVQVIDQAKIPVIVYVGPAGASATSAGALLMLGSHIAAMAPGTNIGAAHPVGPQGEEIKGPAGEKATNDTAAFARGLAEIRGRDVGMAEQIVAKSQSFTAEEALNKKLIELLAPTRADLFKILHGRQVTVNKEVRTLATEGTTIRFAEMTLGQKLLNFLANPNIAGILMSLGVLLIYIELSTPGISIPGILGAICLVVAVMSFQLLPIRTGGLILIIFGITMMLAEPFVISHGALAGGGVLAFVLGLIWVVDPAATSLGISPYIWIPISIGMGMVSFLIAWAATRIRKQSKEALSRIGGGALAGLAGYDGVVETIEGEGKSGKALFRGELWSIESSESLQPGDKVKALRADGMRIQVKKLSPDS